MPEVFDPDAVIGLTGAREFQKFERYFPDCRVFRDAQGRKVTIDELQAVSGPLRYHVYYSGRVPAEPRRAPADSITGR